MSWLLFFFSIEMGIAIDGDYSIPDYNVGYESEYYSSPLFVELSPEVEVFKFLVIYGSIRVNMYKSIDNYDFCPVSLNSKIGIELTYESLSIKLEHQCVHGVLPRGTGSLPEQHDNNSYTQVSIKYDTRNKK